MRQPRRGDPLKSYRAKRDFSRTAEPAAKLGAAEGSRFVVQKHAARRLHYDLRLEHGGVLWSWAVTRGPSLVPGEKRLAVHTEDHPIEYLEFEGVIPHGEYGGGAMIVWDRGTWDPEGDPAVALKKGRLTFVLDGERLKGRWHLVRMRPRPGEKKEQWLLIKADDAFARDTGAPEIVDEATTSLRSGQTTEQLLAAGAVRADHAARAREAEKRDIPLPDPARVKRAKKGLLPTFVEPQLASLSDRAPNGAQWVHEIKFDGYRIQARVDGRKLQLLTRKALDWKNRFPTIAAAVSELHLGSALIDGEVVVENTTGHTSFNDLQGDLKAGRHDRMRFNVFDLLYLEGYDLRESALIDRKELLRAVVERSTSGLIRFSDHIEGDGQTMLEHACRLGLEGIISKGRNLPYRSGRSEDWLKAKCVERQEFVIVGFTLSTASKGALAAVLLGYYDKGKLYHAGRAGTGFSMELAQSLRKELEKLRISKPQFANALQPPTAGKGVTWVEPRLVAEVEFRGWSKDGVLRQAAFKGIREDKPPEEVVRETSAAVPANSRTTRDIGGIKLTHPERILWEQQGITKQGLAEFYADICDWIMPHLERRVLSLVRCPSGVSKPCFYAKHAWAGLSPAIHKVDVGEAEPMLYIEDLAGLLGLVQPGVLEIHPWGSRIEDLEHPDRLIFDLDPGDGVTWAGVISAAQEVRQRLQDLGLKSFVKTSGGKGLHVVFPVEPSLDWDAAKAFTLRIAEQMAADSPDKYLSNMSKKLRRGRIFVDYLRNGRGATAVAPYSTRARPSAAVSVPITWEELTEDVKADHFTIENVRQRLDFLKRDPWHDFFKIKQRLDAADRKLTRLVDGGANKPKARPKRKA